MWIAPHADASDGILDVMTVGPISGIELIRLFSRIFSGTHLSHPAVRRYRAQRVVIDPAMASPLHLDGEMRGSRAEEVEVLPNAVVLAPERGTIALVASASAVVVRRRLVGAERRVLPESWLYGVCLAATVSTYLLIVAGATVRVTGSGLGCPDWPTCHGRLIPPLQVDALIEYSHRLIGAITTPLILAVPVGAVLARRPARVLWPALAIPALLCVQIALGALVVRLELPPMAVLVHLGFAMLILGGLVWITALERGSRGLQAAPRRSLVAPLTGLALVTFLLVLSGAYTRATGASVACTGFPGCDLRPVPIPAVSGVLADPVTIHLFHRTLAYATVIAGLIAGGVLWRYRSGAERRAGAALLLALLLQAAIGAAAVSTGLPAALRGAHVAGAAAAWAAAVLCLALEARAQWAAPSVATAAT